MAEKLRVILERAEREHSAKVLGVAPTASLEQVKERFRFLTQAYQPGKFSTDEQRRAAEQEFERISRAYLLLSKAAAGGKHQAAKLMGVSLSATARELKERFRFLSHAFHPDKFQTQVQRAAAEQEFKAIKEAYDVLSKEAQDSADAEPTATRSSPSKEDGSRAAERSRESAPSHTPSENRSRWERMARVGLILVAMLGLLGGVWQFWPQKAARSPGKPAALHPEAWRKVMSDLEAATHLENGRSQLRLGLRYRDGDGLPKDFKEAAKWFREAASQGIALAQFELGEALSAGRGVAADPKEAAQWHRKAAEQGEVRSQVILGYNYEQGIGVEKNPEESLRWWLKAAYHGNAEAQHRVALHYLNLGSGNPDVSIEWWRKAAEQGHSEAQQRFAAALESGDGTPKNLVESYKWYSLAQAGGNGGCEAALSRLRALMTPEQLAASQRLVMEWRRKGDGR